MKLLVSFDHISCYVISTSSPVLLFFPLSPVRHTWTEEEAENKFTQLSLAFRTDRQTLPERINLHISARDSSERNIKTEIDTIRQIAGVSNQRSFHENLLARCVAL